MRSRAPHSPRRQARSPCGRRARAKALLHRLDPRIALLQPKSDGGLQVRRGRKGQELVRARRNRWPFSGAATIQPTFHPVSEKILPADPTLSVRSAMPGSVASGAKRWPSSRMCSHTSSLMTMRSFARAMSATISKLVRVEQPSGRILRIVEEDRRGSCEFKAASIASPFDPPLRRLQRYFASDPAGPPDHRRVAVIGGREDDHLVAGRRPWRGSSRRAPRSRRWSRRPGSRRAAARDGGRSGPRRPRAAAAARATADIGSNPP